MPRSNAMRPSIDTTERVGEDAGPVPEPELEMGVLAQGFFAAADADNDGFVSKSEFVAYCYKRKGRSPDTSDWKTFYSADANGDGRISREEFEKYVDARWVAESESKSGGKPRPMLDTINIEPDADAPVPEPACELGMLEVGFFDAADTDGDGFVSKSEFAAYRLKQCGQAPSPDDWKAFYAADDNSDGRISRSEFETYVSSQWSGSTFQHDTDDRVVVHSLRSATEHNGKGGVVVAFNPENGRYAVRMDDGSALSVRPGNLRSQDESRTVDADDVVAATADVMPDEDPEIQRARSELARRARARKQEVSDAQAATAAAQVASLEQQRNARVQAEARAQLAKSRTQQKEEALAAAKAQLAQLQAARSADSRSNETRQRNAGPPLQDVGTAESYAYANGRKWTEADVLQLEAEVVALRRSILEQPPAPPPPQTETARIDQMLTSYLGPRDPHFAHPENPQMGEARFEQMLTSYLGPRDLHFAHPKNPQLGEASWPQARVPPQSGLSGRVGLSPEWLAQMNSSTGQGQADDAAAMLSTVRAQIAQLRGELGEGTLT